MMQFCHIHSLCRFVDKKIQEASIQRVFKYQKLSFEGDFTASLVCLRACLRGRRVPRLPGLPD